MSNFFSAPSTPAKTDSERTTSTPSTGKTEINSPYDYDKQVDFEWDNRNKRRRNIDVGVVGETPATVITDRYNRPIFTKENGVLVEVTTKTANGGLYFYEDGNPVPYSNLNMKRDLSADFDLMKKPRTNGGKKRKSRKRGKTVKRRKTMKKKKSKRKY
jgi:hypothetical protein